MFQELTALAITDDTFRREIYLDCTVGPAQSRIYMESVNKIKIEGIDISFKVQDSRFSEIVFDIIVTLVWQKDSQCEKKHWSDDEWRNHLYHLTLINMLIRLETSVNF